MIKEAWGGKGGCPKYGQYSVITYVDGACLSVNFIIIL